MCAPCEHAPQNVRWKDLVQLPKYQLWLEVSLPLPWLILSWGLYVSPLWPFGAVASFMFFLCALRLNHEAIHGNLGISRKWDIALLHLLSAVMLGCNTSIAWSHMQHHRHAMGPNDHEGRCGRMTATQVLIYGPRFPIDLIRACWRLAAQKWRWRILRDGAFVALFVGLCLWSGYRFLLLHMVAMIVAQCLTAFFAVWITHQGTAQSGLAGRSQRGVLAKLAYLMFYHREHHLFPRVPVSRLPDLANRLDAGVPGYAASRLPVFQLLDRPTL